MLTEWQAIAGVREDWQLSEPQERRVLREDGRGEGRVNLGQRRQKS